MLRESGKKDTLTGSLRDASGRVSKKEISILEDLNIVVLREKGGGRSTQTTGSILEMHHVSFEKNILNVIASYVVRDFENGTKRITNAFLQSVGCVITTDATDETGRLTNCSFWN
jgi:hypothetical protein